MLLGDDDGGKTLIIDPGSEATRIEATLSAKALTPSAIVLTHGHVDHVSAAATLQAAYDIPVYMHAEDADWAFGPSNAMAPFYPAPQKPQGGISLISEGDVLETRAGALGVLETPGHSPGSVCLLMQTEHILIAGDTLFAGSIGRTDLPGGNSAALNASLKRLSQLPEDLRVLCGHGSETTLGTEKRRNPFLTSIRS